MQEFQQEFQSLRTRLLRPLFAFTAFAGLVAGLGIYAFSKAHFENELSLRGHILSGAVEIAAETSSSLIDLQRSILALSGEPGIESVSLLDRHFRPVLPNDDQAARFSAAERKELELLAQQALSGSIGRSSAQALSDSQAATYQVVRTVNVSAIKPANVLKPEPALLIVRIDTQESLRSTRKTTVMLLSVSGLIGLVALFWLYLLLNRLVLKPSREIVNVMRMHRQGSTGLTGMQGDDELGVIGATFDELVGTLHAREELLEQAVKKAEEASVAKSQFLANISHELRTPMNAILGMLALLRRTELSERQADYAVKSEGAARSLLRLLNDILDISKAEAGKMELDRAAFSLDQVERDLMVILSTSVGSRPIELSIDVAADVPRYLMGDGPRLLQVLINLGGNAIKFTEAGRVSLAVSLHSREPSESGERIYLDFGVQDSGIGIAPENQAKIFTGFTQAEASTTRRFGGTGLGLAISQHLVALLGGRLALESSLGKGSRFFFRIPFDVLSADAAGRLGGAVTGEGDQNSQTGATQQTSLHQMRILLVEDNENNQQIAVELLEAEGAQLEVASNGQLGVEAVAAASPTFDAVLMDLQMPVMDGLEATRLIREKLGLTHLPIVAMTANAGDSDRADCLAAGMNDHVGKPFDLAELIRVLRQVTRWAETEAEVQPTEQPLPQTNNGPKSERGSERPAVPATPTSRVFATLAVPLDLREQARLQGIDLQSAMDRFMGKSSLFKRMAESFSDSALLLPAQLRGFIEAGDLAEAERAVHTFKGLAATLGCGSLAALAAEGEHELKQGIKPAAAWLIELDAQIASGTKSLGQLAQALLELSASAKSG